MSGLFIAAFGLFAAGALAARRRSISYLFAAAGALLSLCAALLGVAGRHFEALLAVGQGLFVGLRLDHLSATFLSIAATAWVAIALAAARRGRRHPPRIAAGFNLSLAGMLLLFAAADMVSFLAGWEIMTVFAFLMLPEQGRDPVPAFRFLAFGELSQALLVVGFVVLFARNHSLALSAQRIAPPAFLVLASLGAVVKMDIVPFHTWMREVYERLPGFVAALMSACVTLAGVYALERIFSMADFVEWWMLLLVLLGALSAFWGALQSTVARFIRTIPAYSTVEYNGMILAMAALSIVAANGAGRQLEYLAAFAGAAVLILAVSHALAKSLFFLGLGETADLAGVVRLEETRGSLGRFRRLPAMGLLVAALSFAAFPPLVGYLGEWMFLETAFQSYKLATFSERFVASLSGVFVALAIGLAAFAMVRFLAYFLFGRDQTQALPAPAPANGSRTGDGVIAGLAVLVLATSIGAPALLAFYGYGRLFGGLLEVPHPLLLVSGTPTFGVVSPTMFAVVMIVLVAVPFLAWAVRRRNGREVEAWHGGAPIEATERFSSVAFGQILAHVMRGLLKRSETSDGDARSYATHDPIEALYPRVRSFFGEIGGFLSRYYMSGRIGWYVTFIVATFILMLILAAL